MTLVPISPQDDEYELQLRSYQQQYERLKQQYEERQGRLEVATKVRSWPRSCLRNLFWQQETMKSLVIAEFHDAWGSLGEILVSLR